jgi:hypothetical protein
MLLRSDSGRMLISLYRTYMVVILNIVAWFAEKVYHLYKILILVYKFPVFFMVKISIFERKCSKFWIE